eukprot:PLAT3670.2.p1 GENE.PLAT3670.2~~PLAT3670.2.p1  ORF type:complete len:551 (-),score=142.30 PLAT3670.2:178-1830(-)
MPRVHPSSAEDKKEPQEDVEADFDAFDIPELSGESFYGTSVMPKYVTAIARRFPSLDEKELLPYTLLVMALGLCFFLVPLVRMSLVPPADNRAMSVAGRASLKILNDSFLLFFFAPFLWDSIYPCVMSKRQWRLFARWAIGIYSISAVLLTTFGSDAFTRSEKPPFEISLLTAIEDVSQLLVHSIGAAVLMLPAVRKLLGWRVYPHLRLQSSAVGWGFAINVLYTAVAFVFNNFGNPVVLGFGPATLLVWAVAFVLDRNFDGKRNMGYGLALSYITRAGGVGAGALLAVILPIFRSSAAGPLIMLFIFNIAFSFLRLCWRIVSRKLFGNNYDSQAHLFALQIIDDVMGELVFLGARLDSGYFWLAAALNSVKQVLRDTAVLSNFAERSWRRLRGKASLSDEEELVRFELQWRMLKQNLFSELCANLCLPWLFSIDLLWSSIGMGAPAFTSKMNGEEIAHQMGAFGILLLMEVVTHRVVTTLLKRRMAELASKGVFKKPAGRKKSITGSFIHKRNESEMLSYWLRCWPVFTSLLLYAVQDSVLQTAPLTLL